MPRVTHTNIKIKESFVDINNKHHTYEVFMRTKKETERLKALLKRLERS